MMIEQIMVPIGKKTIAKRTKKLKPRQWSIIKTAVPQPKGAL